MIAPVRFTVLPEVADGSTGSAVPVVGVGDDEVEEAVRVEDDDDNDDDDVVEEEEEELVSELVVDELVVSEKLVFVPSVVGVLRMLGLLVSPTLIVGRDRLAVMPVALANTVVARLLAVPHPTCEKPPANWFV